MSACFLPLLHPPPHGTTTAAATQASRTRAPAHRLRLRHTQASMARVQVDSAAMTPPLVVNMAIFSVGGIRGCPGRMCKITKLALLLWVLFFLRSGEGTSRAVAPLLGLQLPRIPPDFSLQVSPSTSLTAIWWPMKEMCYLSPATPAKAPT